MGAKGTHELADDWIDVFKQRSVWDLEVADVERWTARNATFFGLLTELVPAGGRILELGCGPGRHAISAARLGFEVLGIDINPAVVEQAGRNAARVAPEAAVAFRVADMDRLGELDDGAGWDAVTHGGLMEHFPSAASIQASLLAQLELAPLVVFDVPLGTDKNLRLFERDDIFRQDWTAEQWLGQVLAPFHVERAHTELHPDPSMTDDLVVALARVAAGDP
jgi:SAM-dependent methyltransferase